MDIWIQHLCRLSPGCFCDPPNSYRAPQKHGHALEYFLDKDTIENRVPDNSETVDSFGYRHF